MIDVNGVRYHLVLTEAEWGGPSAAAADAAQGKQKWAFDRQRHGVRLQAEVTGLAPPDAAPPLACRYGGAADSFGHRYWLEPDDAAAGRRPRDGEPCGGPVRIAARWAAAPAAETLYPVSRPRPGGRGPFHPAAADEAAPAEVLSGLAVTPDGYLVAGAPATDDLLAFDLYALDGGPTRIHLPAPPRGDAAGLTQAYDLAPLPDGGLLVLDRGRKLVWRLDRLLRPVPNAPAEGEPLVFQPATGPEMRASQTRTAAPVDLAGGAEGPARPVAIEPLPGGAFWVLDTPDDPAAPSTLWRYRPDGRLIDALPLRTANFLEPGEDPLELDHARGHDFAYLPERDAEGRETDRGVLFVAGESGRQAFAFEMDFGPGGRHRIRRLFYPMRNYAGTDLAADRGAGIVYYRQAGRGDAAADRAKARWLPLRELPIARYEAEAELALPPMDGREPGCVWHRLCLDACIPAGTSVAVAARAAETPDDLAVATWIEQPRPYRRTAGSEIPYHNLWREDERADPDTGTWELLFQQVRGRYGQLRLTLTGDRRKTPFIRGLRSHYPRFSYAAEYLPGVYRQDPGSSQFIENFLANPEGILTTLEGLIAQAQTLFDAAAAPAEALDWLAGWLGLAFEPGWSDYQRRLLIAQAPTFFLRRGTRPGLLQALLLAIRPELGPCIFRDDIDVSTVRIVEQFLTRGESGGDAQDAAHRFAVMTPVTLDRDTMRRVERVIQLEKPAHTAFTIKPFWALFRVGEARLGIDTTLGEGARFELFRLGQSGLAEAALGAAFPFTLDNRAVVGR